MGGITGNLTRSLFAIEVVFDVRTWKSDLVERR